jgi:hypothetical protein
MYEIELQTIRFSNGKKYHFPVEVAEAIDFDEAIVVRLAESHPMTTQNIVGLDHQGNLLWNMPAPRSFSPQNPYVCLYRKGDYVEVLNWDGHIVTLLPKQGVIVAEDFYSGGGGHSRRAPSPRRWL